MQVTAIIPARFGSVRFPGKPLAQQTGKFLIQHVYEQVLACERIGRCIVATDDRRIADAVESFGGEARMTSPDHASGTDRIAEVVEQLGGSPNDIVVNVQGDEPEIEPAHLDRLVARLASETECPTATLACPFPEDGDPCDPNCVKVVTNRSGRALYFSRALVPYPRDGQAPASGYLLHLGVYAYRRAFLLEYATWEHSRLETTERLEQLRVLDYGYPMAVEIVEGAAVGIDTPEEYERFVKRWRQRAGQT